MNTKNMLRYCHDISGVCEVVIVVHSKAQQELVVRSKRGKSVQQSPSFTMRGTREKKEQGQLVLCYVGFLIN